MARTPYAVKQDQNCHYFALGHGERAISFFCLLTWQRLFFDSFIKFFEKFIDHEINFSNFIVCNYSGIELLVNI